MQLRPKIKATEAFATDMDFQQLLAQKAELQLQYETAVSYLESLRTKINEQKSNYQVRHSREAAVCFRVSEQVQQILMEAGLPVVKSHFASMNIRIRTYNLNCANYREAQCRILKSKEYHRLMKAGRVIKKDLRTVRPNITQISSYASTLDLIIKRLEKAYNSLEFIPVPIHQSREIVKDVIANIIELEERAGMMKSAFNDSKTNNARLKQLNELEMSLAFLKRHILALQRRVEITAAAVNKEIGCYQKYLYEFFSSLSIKIKLIRNDVASVVDRFLSLPHSLEIIEP